MAVDWIGFAYAALLAVGGILGYTRKGSKISLAAGLTFGSMAGYGAYCVTRDPRNVKISLFSAFLLTVIMGMRFKRSKKLMPAGLVACLREPGISAKRGCIPLAQTWRNCYAGRKRCEKVCTAQPCRAQTAAGGEDRC